MQTLIIGFQQEEERWGSPNLSTEHNIIIVLHSEIPMNLWDFGVLIIWERWDQMSVRGPSSFHSLWCHEQVLLGLF